jgi:hypothetical protein
VKEAKREENKKYSFKTLFRIHKIIFKLCYARKLTFLKVRTVQTACGN